MIYYKIGCSENFMAEAMFWIINYILQTIKSGQILHHFQLWYLEVQGTWALEIYL